mgnify:CR=1 FL=1
MNSSSLVRDDKVRNPRTNKQSEMNLSNQAIEDELPMMLLDDLKKTHFKRGPKEVLLWPDNAEMKHFKNLGEEWNLPEEIRSSTIRATEAARISWMTEKKMKRKSGPLTTLGIRRLKRGERNIWSKLKREGKIHNLKQNRSCYAEKEGPLRGTPDGVLFSKSKGKGEALKAFPVEIKTCVRFKSKEQFKKEIARPYVSNLRINNDGRIELVKHRSWWRQLLAYSAIFGTPAAYLLLHVEENLHLIKCSFTRIEQDRIRELAIKQGCDGPVAG